MGHLAQGTRHPVGKDPHHSKRYQECDKRSKEEHFYNIAPVSVHQPRVGSREHRADHNVPAGKSLHGNGHAHNVMGLLIDAAKRSQTDVTAAKGRLHIGAGHDGVLCRGL